MTNSNGTLTVITDVANDTEAGANAFTLGSFSTQDNSATALANGLFRLTLAGGSEGNGAGQITCATTDGAPRLIACYGYYNTDNNQSDDRRPITILGRIR